LIELILLKMIRLQIQCNFNQDSNDILQRNRKKQFKKLNGRIKRSWIVKAILSKTYAGAISIPDYKMYTEPL
jgi:hypothetical protein